MGCTMSNNAEAENSSSCRLVVPDFVSPEYTKELQGYQDQIAILCNNYKVSIKGDDAFTCCSMLKTCLSSCRSSSSGWWMLLR